MSKKVLTNIDMGGRNIENVGNMYDKPTIDTMMENVPKSREMTYNEYMALSDEEKNDGTVYYITDVNDNGEVTKPSADGVSYDNNTENGLQATTVQGAVDELNNKLTTLGTDITSINTKLAKKSPLLTVGTIYGSATIAAGTVGSITVATTKSGYRAIGIVGVTPNNASLTVQSFYIEQSSSLNAKVGLRNNNANVSVTASNIVIFVLYLATS